MEKKQRFKAVIAGKQYTIVGNRSVAHLTAVTELLNQQLKQLGELSPELSVADRSILMALNAISDQLVKEQRIEELEAQVRELTQSAKKSEKVPFKR